MEKKRTRDIRFWVLVWGLGLVGQLCWNIENQWFNTFVYAKIAKDPTIISWMVAISAIATTIATFLFGTLSDRKASGKISSVSDTFSGASSRSCSARRNGSPAASLRVPPRF